MSRPVDSSLSTVVGGGAQQLSHHVSSRPAQPSKNLGISAESNGGLELVSPAPPAGRNPCLNLESPAKSCARSGRPSVQLLQLALLVLRCCCSLVSAHVENLRCVKPAKAAAYASRRLFRPVLVLLGPDLAGCAVSKCFTAVRARHSMPRHATVAGLSRSGDAGKQASLADLCCSGSLSPSPPPPGYPPRHGVKIEAGGTTRADMSISARPN